MTKTYEQSGYLFLTLLFFSVSTFSQEETGNWLMYFGTNRVSDKFSVHTEIQYRNHTVNPNNIEQLLLRTGLNYHFSNKASVSTGYAYITSYIFESDEKSPETKEHRIWQQFILTNKIGRVKFEHRYRIEQRWINQDYKNRFRYRLMLFIPLNEQIIEKGTLFLGLYDEIFINTEEPYFDRNRLYGALGYQFNKSTSVQAGMMHQQLTNYGKWYLQFALVFNPDLRNKNN
jgi:hypothetical protein